MFLVILISGEATNQPAVKSYEPDLPTERVGGLLVQDNDKFRLKITTARICKAVRRIDQREEDRDKQGKMPKHCRLSLILPLTGISYQ